MSSRTARSSSVVAVGESPRLGWGKALVAIAALGLGACSGADPSDPEAIDEEVVEASEEEDGAIQSLEQGLGDHTRVTNANTPIGLALMVDNGVGKPVTVRARQTFYLNQLDIRASLENVAVDEGVAGLDRTGDFRNLDWRGVKLRDEAYSANADGTFLRRRFYRDAKWMDRTGYITVRQVDRRGLPTSGLTVLRIGKDNAMNTRDDFFVRRLRAIQWGYDCPAEGSCAGATNFSEEGLVELRNTMSPEKTFRIHQNTTALKVFWTERLAEYTIPVTQEAQLEYDYGFKIAVTAVTPPRPNGTYAPGTAITFRMTLKDGAGNNLYPQGNYPSYNEVVTTGVEQARTGISYYGVPFDPSATYWRAKHRERMLMSQIAGPAQLIQPIRSIQGLEVFLDPPDVQSIATLERDGTYSEFRIFPTANQLFAGVWDQPVPDTWTYTIPANAPSGTYYVTTKGRRVFKGEDIPYTSQVAIQVGTPTVTQPVLTTGPCTSCHSGGGELSKVLHANDNRATCAGCHAPLAFELEGPIFVRTHYIHSRSDRFEPSLSKCSSCHLNNQGIQRTSKAACLSCHKSYPQSHVTAFGPITDSYVGGGAESFQACAANCHTSHPGSGL